MGGCVFQQKAQIKCNKCLASFKANAHYCPNCGVQTNQAIQDDIQYQIRLSNQKRKMEESVQARGDFQGIRQQKTAIKDRRKNQSTKQQQKKTMQLKRNLQSIKQQQKQAKLSQIQMQLSNLQQDIAMHRSETTANNNCWYFGIKGLQKDYGPIWSSCSYWHSLIRANKRLCIDKMHFQQLQTCCQKCATAAQKLQALKDIWQSKAKEHYGLVR